MAYNYSNQRLNPLDLSTAPRAITEYLTIAELDNLPGTYGLQLRDAPVQDTITVVTDDAQKKEFIIVSTTPQAGQLGVRFVNGIAPNGLLIANVADAGTAVKVDYQGLGSANTVENTAAIAEEAGEQAAIDWLATYQGPTLPGALYGCEIANDGTTPESKLVVSSGKCMDSTDSVWLTVPAWTLDLSAPWAAGDGAGKMVDGSGLTAEETYHVFAITDGAGAVDFCVSPNLSPTLPAGFTHYRRIGSRQTDALGDLIVVHQSGDWHEYDEVQVPLDSVAISTSGALYALGTPAGVSTRAAVIASPGYPAGTGGNALAVSLTGADTQGQLPAAAPRLTEFRGLVSGERDPGYWMYASSSYALITTDTAGQIWMRRAGAYHDAGSTTVQLLGYYDRRGKR